MQKYDIIAFQQRILAWYAVNKRSFPRRDTFDPYKVFISETMSQQTQVNRVIPKFNAWMHELPDLVALAQVEKTRLLHLWSGL
jgi:A/G-specific adenine glycosylase